MQEVTLTQTIPGPIRARVAKVEGVGRFRHIVCYPIEKVDLDGRDRQGITVGLPEWQGKGEPKARQVITVSTITLTDSGWRAASAEPVRTRAKRA